MSLEALQKRLHRIPYRDREFLVSSVVFGGSDIIQAIVRMEEELRDSWWDIHEGDVVFDVGASWGGYTLAALTAGASVCVSVEPSRPEFCELCSNHLVNGCKGTLVPVFALLSEEIGVSDWYPDTHSTRGGDLHDQRICLTVDHIVSGLGLGKLSWIKVDVEGGELGVIKGAMQSITHFRPRMLVENHLLFSPGIDEEIRKILLPLGYKEETRTGVGDNDHWSLWTPD